MTSLHAFLVLSSLSNLKLSDFYLLICKDGVGQACSSNRQGNFASLPTVVIQDSTERARVHREAKVAYAHW